MTVSSHSNQTKPNTPYNKLRTIPANQQSPTRILTNITPHSLTSFVGADCLCSYYYDISRCLYGITTIGLYGGDTTPSSTMPRFPGLSSAKLMFRNVGLSFWGGVHYHTGKIIDHHDPLCGTSLEEYARDASHKKRIPQHRRHSLLKASMTN